MITERQYDAGAVIFLENTIGETAYVIEHGRVEVLKKLDGKNVHLAYIGPGEPFGEMSMIDEKPRSATVVAVEKTTVRELHRDEFLPTLQSQPDMAISLLKILFERLREADATILQLHRSHPELVQLPQRQSRIAPSAPGNVVCLEGLTLHANKVLPKVPFQITKFPFRIGRLSSDPLVDNDLSIPDSSPWQVSRHHVAFVKEDCRIGVSDRGSRLGSWVDGTLLGGHGGYDGTLFFSGGDATLVLGEQLSPFRFKVSIREYQGA
jgi:CRP/FNR family cyclic AMP-dependent transcriptional regulator